jgi:hypothetical protein
MASAGNDRDAAGSADADSDADPDRQAKPVSSALRDPGANASGSMAPVDNGNREDPLEVVASFVAAVAWGEHLRVWELLSSEARRVVLRVAVTRGMDERLAARLRDGTAVRSERDTFLTDLINGLRADLRGSDLDSLDVQPDPDLGQPDPDHARMMLMAPLVSAALGAPLPVASVELVRELGQWRIEHLLPRARA